MSQAIQTKYFGPGNVRGSRIKATAWAGSITINVDNRWNQEINHANAALALAEKLDWLGAGVHIESGCLADGSWAHVLVYGKVANEE